MAICDLSEAFICGICCEFEGESIRVCRKKGLAEEMARKLGFEVWGKA